MLLARNAFVRSVFNLENTKIKNREGGMPYGALLVRATLCCFLTKMQRDLSRVRENVEIWT
jgi:hypothetical protein